MTVYYAHTHTLGDLKQSRQVPDKDYYTLLMFMQFK